MITPALQYSKPWLNEHRFKEIEATTNATNALILRRIALGVRAKRTQATPAEGL
jgi:hypothetical protein